MAEKEDRNVVPADEKGRILDFFDRPITPPSSGIYEGQIRLYAANLEWATIIEGLIDFLATPAAWDDSVTDESHHAIQQILIFEEGITMTLKEDIRDGLYEAMNNLAKQVVSGGIGGFSVDADGNVTVGSGTDGDVVETPEDDPLTQLDESAAARSGGCNAIRLGMNKLFSQMDGFFTSGLPVATAKTRLKLLYTLNEVEADAFVDFYYTSYALATNPIVLSSTLDSFLFCKGVNTQSIARYAYESHTPSGDVATIEALLPALGEQLNLWYADGTEEASTDYITYSCTPVNPETFTWDATKLNANVSQVGVEVHKLNHRILIEVEGKVNHPSNGSYQDFFYHVAADGTKTFIGVGTSQGTLQWNQPFGTIPQAKVPFAPSGKYAVTMETTTAQVASHRRTILTANQAAGTTGFTVKLTDLGEVFT